MQGLFGQTLREVGGVAPILNAAITLRQGKAQDQWRSEMEQAEEAAIQAYQSVLDSYAGQIATGAATYQQAQNQAADAYQRALANTSAWYTDPSNRSLITYNSALQAYKTAKDNFDEDAKALYDTVGSYQGSQALDKWNQQKQAYDEWMWIPIQGQNVVAEWQASGSPGYLDDYMRKKGVPQDVQNFVKYPTIWASQAVPSPGAAPVTVRNIPGLDIPTLQTPTYVPVTLPELATKPTIGTYSVPDAPEYSFNPESAETSMLEKYAGSTRLSRLGDFWDAMLSHQGTSSNTLDALLGMKAPKIEQLARADIQGQLSAAQDEYRQKSGEYEKASADEVQRYLDALSTELGKYNTYNTNLGTYGSIVNSNLAEYAQDTALWNQQAERLNRLAQQYVGDIKKQYGDYSNLIGTYNQQMEPYNAWTDVARQYADAYNTWNSNYGLTGPGMSYQTFYDFVTNVGNVDYGYGTAGVPNSPIVWNFATNPSQWISDMPFNYGNPAPSLQFNPSPNLTVSPVPTMSVPEWTGGSPPTINQDALQLNLPTAPSFDFSLTPSQYADALAKIEKRNRLAMTSR